MSFPIQWPCQLCCKERVGSHWGSPSVGLEGSTWAGEKIAAEFDIEPSMPRTTGRQQHRVNVPATNPESHWQRAARIKQRRPRWDVCGVQERSDRQERVGQRDVALENKVAAFNWRTTSNSGWNPTLYRNVNTILTTLLTMPVTTATLERSFSAMRRVKTYLRETMKTERLSALAQMYAYMDITIDEGRGTGC